MATLFMSLSKRIYLTFNYPLHHPKASKLEIKDTKDHNQSKINKTDMLKSRLYSILGFP